MLTRFLLPCGQCNGPLLLVGILHIHRRKILVRKIIARVVASVARKETEEWGGIEFGVRTGTWT